MTYEQGFGLFAAGILTDIPMVYGEEPKPKPLVPLPDKMWLKNINYTEEQLGFKRKWKGRYVMYGRKLYQIVVATPHGVVIQREEHRIPMSYSELKCLAFQN
jgi:hypothetical protein